MMEVPVQTLALGAVVGMTYGLLAAGLVLIYRSNGIVNFAHGQIGAFAAAVLGVAVLEWNVPYWLAFLLALLTAAAVGTVAEAGVVRRLRAAPPLMSVVATLGLGQLLVLLAYVISDRAAAGASFPRPPGMPVFDIGPLRVTEAYSAMLLLSPVAIIAIGVFLKRSRYGLAIRAASDNASAARMAGIFPGRMSALSWGLAGALSAFTAVLTQPTRGVSSPETFGPDLLLRAVAAAVLARMNSLPVAVAAGVGLGIIEHVLLWNQPDPGAVDATLFVVILVALLLQRRVHVRSAVSRSWSAVESLTGASTKGVSSRWVRHFDVVLGLLFLGVLAALPLVLSNTDSATITAMLALAIVGMSVGLLSGLAGQLTLGPFAVAAIGAVACIRVSQALGSFPLGLLAAALAAGLVSLILGLPALRMRGLMLTVTTLGFAIATPAWLLGQPWMLGEGMSPGRPILGTRALDTAASYYYFAFAVFVLVLWISRNVRRSGFARLLVATRDNEQNAQAFAVGPRMVTARAYIVAGAIAGLGGAVYSHSLSVVGASTFSTKLSIDVVVLTVLGGVSALVGPVLGAIYVVGVPEFGPRLLPFGNLGLAATQMGALLFILWKPGGLVQALAPLRSRLLRVLTRRDGTAPAEERGTVQVDARITEPASPVPREHRPRASLVRERGGRDLPSPGGEVLRASGLEKRYGGVTAVADVSLSVRHGEVVGLIGPNGAGKTTTFELLGGFVTPDSGRVEYLGRDITRWGPTHRARLGLIRSFQDAALFPSLTVLECVMVALEREAPTRLLPAVCGWQRGDRDKNLRARELVCAMGLEDYQHTQVRALSTGTRRIAEIACLLALDPTVLLLDEPASGVAQRDTEAMTELLGRLHRDLEITMVVIEHDIPMIMHVADRIVAMADGRVIADGTPEEVRRDPAVVTAYLGTDGVAIERSGSVLSTS